jgi:colanic acid biosynthesis glycosyl transferase WcaI
MKKILLISYNFAPELTGIGKYNGELIEWLVNRGYDCSVLTAYPYYPDWKVQGPYRARRFWYSTENSGVSQRKAKLTVYRCPTYIPGKPSGVKRIILDVSFFLSALIRLLILITHKKYDVLITVAPSFHVGLLGLLWKHIQGAKLVYHIQDLQIEAARDLNMVRWNAMIRLMFFVERQILRHADVTSSISDGMVNRVRAKGGNNTILFPNWTNTSQLFPVEDHRYIKAKFGFNATDKIVMYSGAIGEKQGLESILLTALENRDNDGLKFIICGNGPYKEHLRQTALRLRLSNVLFLPLQEPEQFNHFLNVADIHLVIQKAGASDLVMPSKLGPILSIGGLALITANRGTSLHSLVDSHKMGYLIDAEDQYALTTAIQDLLNGDYQYMRKNARDYAVQFLSIDKVMTKFETMIDTLFSEKSSHPIKVAELTDQVRV